MLKYVIIIFKITDRKAGFEFKDRNLVFLNQPMTSYIPFFIKVRLPKPDHGKRGFSGAYINKVRKRLYGKEADLISGGSKMIQFNK